MSSYSEISKLFRFCLSAFSCCLIFGLAAKSQTPFKLPVLNPQQKVALIIGNGDYAEITKLKNPKNDAKLIGDTLRAIGFQVIYRYDTTQAEMEDAFREFAKTLGQNSVALFYYAGHGLQIGGKNYLVPTDYNSQKKVAGLWDIGAALDSIAGKSRMNIIVLDSCRDTPKGFYESLQGNVGFTEFKNTPDGTFVAFSTSPGKTALDGSGENSPYAAVLAEGLRWRPAQLEQVFMFTQLRVEENTGGKQVPWRNSSTKSLFFFTPDEIALAPAVRPVVQSKLQKEVRGGLQTFQFNVPYLNERGTLLGQKPGTAQGFIEQSGFVALEMVQINGGRFLMGASDTEVSDTLALAKKIAEFDADAEFDAETYEVLSAELPRHAVNVKGFYMSRYEITQAQYAAVMKKLPPIEPKFRGANMPVVNVTWTEANEFCAKLSSATGRLYRLPTEAEWEYAARGGSDTPFPFGETINQQVAAYNWAIPYNKAPRATRRTAPTEVGALNSSNAFGLQDMNGNVWEWVADYWHSDYDGAPVDGSSWDEPQAVESDDVDEADAIDSSRVARGGSWFSPASRLRSASRYRYSPTTRASSLGFRVVVQ